MKKSLVQLAFNPFLHGRLRVKPGFRVVPVPPVHTLVEACVDTECDVDADDSELETDSGDPGRLIFLRFRGRPFNLGAVGKISYLKKKCIYINILYIL